MLIVILVMWLAFTGLGSWIATVKNRSGEEGAVLGLLFGPFGCLIEALLPTLAPDESSAERFKTKIQTEASANPPSAPLTDEELARVATVESRLRAEQARQDEEARLRRAQREAQHREQVYVERQESLRRREERRDRISRFVWGFGWFKALPDVVQPIVIGLAVALPIIALIVRAMQP